MGTPLHAAKNTPPASPEKLHRLAALFGGEEIIVKKEDGTDIKVKVGLVPVRHLGTFIDLYDKPAELVDFITHIEGKPVEAGWADCLTDIAVEQIYAKAKELNFSRAVDFGKKEVTAGKEIRMPIATLMMELQSSVLAQALSSLEAAKKLSASQSLGSSSP